MTPAASLTVPALNTPIGFLTQHVLGRRRKCNGKDHFSKMCRTKGPKKQNVNSVEVNQKEFAFIAKEERLTFCVGGVDLKMLVDSGATSNVMGENVGTGRRHKRYSVIHMCQKNREICTHTHPVSHCQLRGHSSVKSKLVTGLIRQSSS